MASVQNSERKEPSRVADLKSPLLSVLGIPRPLARLGREAAWLSKGRPLFVLGTPRSGTTLLTRLLDAHPRIFLTNENGALVQMHHALTGMRQKRPAGLPYDIDSKEFYEEWSAMIDELVPLLVKSFYGRLLGPKRASAITYWGDKHPHFDACLPSLLRWYPEARYIYIVRHPIDVLHSIARMNRWDHDRAFEHWKTITGQYERQVETIPSSARLVVRYEDLTADIGSSVSRVLEWLELDTTPAILGLMERIATLPAHQLRRDPGDPPKAPAQPSARPREQGSPTPSLPPVQARRYLNEARLFLKRHYPEALNELEA